MTKILGWPETEQSAPTGIRCPRSSAIPMDWDIAAPNGFPLTPAAQITVLVDNFSPVESSTSSADTAFT
jgi:hypothetical protein